MKRPTAFTGVFVAGTDTGVGKTALSCGLLAAARTLGQRLVPFKPAESGCTYNLPADAAALRAAARSDLPLLAICPFPIRPPIAPAAATGLRLSRTRLLAAARRLVAADVAARAAQPHSTALDAEPSGTPLLVEAAGGLLSPYAPRLTAADLADALGLPVLLVARNGLGTINHTALCIAELRRRRVPLLGLALMTTRSEPNLGAQRNAALIEAQTGVYPDVVIPYLPKPTEKKISARLLSSGAARRWLGAAGLL